MGLLGERSGDEEEQGDISIAGLEDLDQRGTESVYDLDDWGRPALALLRERLTTLGVPHRWEDEVSLVVTASDEAWVERIMDQVEDDVAGSLDPDLPQVAYDLTDWTVERREALFTHLDDEAVPFGVDGEELFVHEIDESRVDELIEVVLDPGRAPDAASARIEVLGELYQAVDQLVRDPAGPPGALALLDARSGSEPATPPYGMDPTWWQGLLGEVDDLLARLDEEDPDIGSVEDQARELRDRLRPYV